MLVLTRKIGQKLIIADNIEVVVLDTRGDTVKLGIHAPRDVSIFREELLTEVKQANKSAAPNQADLDSALGGLSHKKPSPLKPGLPTIQTPVPKKPHP